MGGNGLYLYCIVKIDVHCLVKGRYICCQFYKRDGGKHFHFVLNLVKHFLHVSCDVCYVPVLLVVLPKWSWARVTVYLFVVKLRKEN